MDDNHPLTQYALQTFYDRSHNIPHDKLRRAADALDKYLKGELLFDDTLNVLISTINSRKPLDTLYEIVKMRNQPVAKQNFDLTNSFSRRPRTNKWSEYEDKRLLAGIWLYGVDDWNRISAFVGNNRNKGQCSQRWKRGLNPRILKTPWSAEADIKLVRLVDQYGDKKWTKISKEMGDRSDVQCRYRYSQLKRIDKFEELVKNARELGDDSNDVRNTPTLDQHNTMSSFGTNGPALYQNNDMAASRQGAIHFYEMGDNSEISGLTYPIGNTPVMQQRSIVPQQIQPQGPPNKHAFQSGEVVNNAKTEDDTPRKLSSQSSFSDLFHITQNNSEFF